MAETGNNLLILCACGCGGEIVIKKHHKYRGIPKYIHGHNGRGKCFSKETKEKMSIAKLGKSSPHKGKKRPNLSGDKNGMYGIHLSGKNSPNWKNPKNRISLLNHAIRTTIKYIDWRTQVFGRDNFTCQKCGVRGSWLEAHHRKRFSLIVKEYNIKTIEESLMCDELWDFNNGITLCKKCHGFETWEEL